MVLLVYEFRCGTVTKTKFTTVEDDGDLIIEGGNVYGERFIKD